MEEQWTTMPPNRHLYKMIQSRYQREQQEAQAPQEPEVEAQASNEVETSPDQINGIVKSMVKTTGRRVFQNGVI